MIVLVVIIAALASHKSKPTNVSDLSTKQGSTNSSPNTTKNNAAPAAPNSNDSSTGSTTNPQQSPPSTPSCSPASSAAGLEGTTACINFTGYAYTSSRGEMYLDQYTSAPYGFSVYIQAGSSFGPGVLSQYSGQSIDVTGAITNYNGEPEIEVYSASQIQAAQ